MHQSATLFPSFLSLHFVQFIEPHSSSYISILSMFKKCFSFRNSDSDFQHWFCSIRLLQFQLLPPGADVSSPERWPEAVSAAAHLQLSHLHCWIVERYSHFRPSLTISGFLSEDLCYCFFHHPNFSTNAGSVTANTQQTCLLRTIQTRDLFKQASIKIVAVLVGGANLP